MANGLVPFFIDWGDTPHPAKSAAAGATLISLRAEHPDPENVQRMLGGLGLVCIVPGMVMLLIGLVLAVRRRRDRHGFSQ